MPKNKKKRRGYKKMKKQFGGINFADTLTQFNSDPALASVLGQTNVLGSGFNAQLGNAGNIMALLASSLNRNNTDPRLDRRLTFGQGSFGFRDGGSPAIAVDVDVKIASDKKSRRKYRKMLKKYSDKVNKIREDALMEEAKTMKEFIKRQFNGQHSINGLTARDIAPIERRQTGGFTAPLRQLDLIRPVGLAGGAGDFFINGDITTFSPLIPTRQQAQQAAIQQQIASAQQNPFLAQLGLSVGAQTAVPQQTEAAEPPTLGGLPVNPNGLFAERGPVVVPSRDLTFQGIDVPTAVIPIPGLNSVVEMPLARVTINRDGDDEGRRRRRRRRKTENEKMAKKYCFPETGPDRNFKSHIKTS